MENILVSVIIPSFNRYVTLKRVVDSIKEQTYKNIEIIVVNDGSTDSRYYENPIEGINMINLPENSRIKFGYPNIGYVVNQGLYIAKGQYIGVIGDDDIYLPTKIEEQINVLSKNEYFICGTDAYQFHTNFDKNNLDIYTNCRYKNCHLHLYKNFSGNDQFPTLWNFEMLSFHNFVIASSVVFNRCLLESVGYFNETRDVLGMEDWDYWKRAVAKVGYLYNIDKPLVAYDLSHGALNK
jgi:glycosyltransferase involved in cell wall biosynthesis